MIETTVGGNAPATGDALGGSTQEHIDKMVALADGQTPPATEGEATSEGTTTETTTESEETSSEAPLLAGKFKTQEDLEKGYLELQKRFSAGERGESETTTETPESAELPPKPAEGETEGETAGESEGSTPAIDFEKYSKSFSENGSLTDDDYTELEAKGIPRPVVDAYVRGVQAEATERTDAAVEAAGGQERFDAIREWAGTGLSEAEYNAVANQIASATSAEEIALVYQTLAVRYDKANPSEPSLVSGKTPAVTPGRGFSSRKEMTDAIADPRYRTDAKYREEVAQRIGASDFM